MDEVQQRASTRYTREGTTVDTIECTTGAVVPTGEIANGSLRAEDLLAAALATFEAVNPAGFVILSVEHADILVPFVKTRTSQINLGTPFDFTDYQMGRIIDLCGDVVDGINEALPDGWYYGGIEGDPACVGIWQTEAEEV